jgi:hypothetical protein
VFSLYTSSCTKGRLTLFLMRLVSYLSKKKKKSLRTLKEMLSRIWDFSLILLRVFSSILLLDSSVGLLFSCLFL